MAKAVLLIVLFVYSSVFTADAAESKEVVISQGTVKGYKSTEGNHFVFYGIPYARQPTGIDKFKAPLAAPTWKDTYEAIEKGIICPQYYYYQASNRNKTVGNNCLIANVYVPDTNRTNLPVVVYFHGGGFQTGDGVSLTPHGIVDDGQVIAVNFNYRLGAFGFLCLGTEGIPGNAGLKDMLALLRWVNKEIACFGGNPNDVTITGYSAGSVSVELMMLSKAASGLFQKVIPESGSMLSVWAVQPNPSQNAKDFAVLLGLPFNKTNDICVLEEFLVKATNDELTAYMFSNLTDGTLFFQPCVEIDTGTEMFLDDTPINILTNENYEQVPILVGFNNMEGILALDFFATYQDLMNSNFSMFLPADLEFCDETERDEVASSIKEFYFGNSSVSNETVQAYVDFTTDIQFIYPLIRSIRLQVAAGSSAIYFYEYQYADSNIIQDYLAAYPTVFGATHCAQSLNILETTIPYYHWTEANATANFQKMRTQLHDLWISFIKNGDPVAEKTSSSTPTIWSAVSCEYTATPYMALNLTSEQRTTQLLPDRICFWDGIYDLYYRSPSTPSNNVFN